MHSAQPAYSRNVPIVCFLFLTWFVYLSTLLRVMMAGAEDSGQTLLPNGVAQFLSSGVTQFVIFWSFLRINVQEEINLKYHNYLKNKENNYFPWGGKVWHWYCKVISKTEYEIRIWGESQKAFGFR